MMNPNILESAVANDFAGFRRLEPERQWSVFEKRFSRPKAPAPIVALLDRGLQTLSAGEILRRLSTADNPVLVLTAAPPPPPAIRDLQLLREEEETTAQPITHHAYFHAKAVLDYVHRMLGDEHPQPHLAPDGVGGIRMEWFMPNANIRVVIPPREDQRRYIYRLANNVPELKQLSPVSVFHALRPHADRR